MLALRPVNPQDKPNFPQNPSPKNSGHALTKYFNSNRINKYYHFKLQMLVRPR